MLSIWKFFLEKRSFSYLLLVTMILFGVYSVFSIPKESNPEIKIPVVNVITVLAGAAPSDIEELITNKIEDQLSANLDDVKKITSSSQEGVSAVTVEFLSDVNVKEALDQAKEEVDVVKSELPKDAQEPRVSDVNFVDQPIMLLSVASDLPAIEFLDVTKDIIDELEQIKGVSRVEKSGISDRGIQVVVDAEALNAYKLNISDVLAAIHSTNTSLPVGNIEMNGVAYSVVFEGDIQSVSEINDIAILQRNGEPIYVRDVAFVSDGLEETKSISRVSIDGNLSQQAVLLSVFKSRGGNLGKLTQNIADQLEVIQEGLGESVEVLISYDTGEFLRRDLSNLSNTGLQTVLLVMVILFLALGWREAVVAGLAIPLSFLIAFVGLFATGNSINFVSLFSLILAVGILVDSAIVVTEGVHTNMLAGQNRTEAALNTIREFQWPLISGTATTIAVFAPLFFISGVTGEFIAVIPFTIIFVLAASLFVALGIIPLIASSLLKKNSDTDMEKKQEFFLLKIQKRYSRALATLLNDKKKENAFFVFLTVLLFITLSFPMTGIVKTIFFGGEDLDFFYIEIETPQGTVLEETDLVARYVEDILYKEPFVESFVTTVGAGSAFADGGFGGGSGGKLANVTVLLDKERELTSGEIVKSLRKKFSDINFATVRALEISSGPPVGKPIVITFTGDNLEDLQGVASDAEELLRSIKGASEVDSSMKDDGTEFVLRADKAKMSELGISSAHVAEILYTAVYGAEATSINHKGEDVDVTVKLNLNAEYKDPFDTNRTTIDAINYLEIPTPKGPVLLGSLIKTDIGLGSAVIRHEEGERVVSVSSEVAEGYTTEDVLSIFKEKSKTGLNVRDGVEMNIGGENQEVDQSFKDMFVALIAGMILVMAVLVVQFNSFRQSFYIISIVPLSLIGIFIGLAVSGKELSFPSIMGYIALSGIVVNNAIILIDVINKNRGTNKNLQEVIIEGAVSRIRPILLTTLTTVIGIIPLIYAAEIWAPLAFAIMFGLSFASIITLFLIPVLYHKWPGDEDGMV